jgi:hypothetical protein
MWTLKSTKVQSLQKITPLCLFSLVCSSVLSEICDPVLTFHQQYYLGLRNFTIFLKTPVQVNIQNIVVWSVFILKIQFILLLNKMKLYIMLKRKMLIRITMGTLQKLKLMLFYLHLKFWMVIKGSSNLFILLLAISQFHFFVLLIHATTLYIRGLIHFWDYIIWFTNLKILTNLR